MNTPCARRARDDRTSPKRRSGAGYWSYCFDAGGTMRERGRASRRVRGSPIRRVTRQSRGRAGGGRGRAGAAVGQHQRDGNIAAAVTVFDDFGERLFHAHLNVRTGEQTLRNSTRIERRCESRACRTPADIGDRNPRVTYRLRPACRASNPNVFLGLLDWKSWYILRNTGPGAPPAKGLPSTVVTASTSLVDDDSHISSAANASSRGIGRTSTASPPSRANSNAAS